MQGNQSCLLLDASSGPGTARTKFCSSTPHENLNLNPPSFWRTLMKNVVIPAGLCKHQHPSDLLRFFLCTPQVSYPMNFTFCSTLVMMRSRVHVSQLKAQSTSHRLSEHRCVIRLPSALRLLCSQSFASTT